MAGHERTVPELIKTAKALQAKAEHAAGKAEQFYISLGLTLQELKQRKPKDITWPAFVSKHFTLGRRRADELIQIASGTTTVDASRERARVGMKRSRQNGRNVTPGRPVKPATEKEMQEYHRQQTANECKLWLAEHLGRTPADYTKLLNDPNMLDNELGNWRRAKARAFDDAMRRDWLIEHPGEEPLPEHECAFDAEASRWIDDYRSKRRQVSAVANNSDDLPMTIEDDHDGNTFLVHDGKQIAKRLPDESQWTPLVPGVRVTTEEIGPGQRRFTADFDADAVSAIKPATTPSIAPRQRCPIAVLNEHRDKLFTALNDYGVGIQSGLLRKKGDHSLNPASRELLRDDIALMTGYLATLQRILEQGHCDGDEPRVTATSEAVA